MSVIVSPDNYYFLRNRIAIEFFSDRYVASTGNASVNTLTFNAGATDSSSLAFERGDGLLFFWFFSDNPQNQGIPAYQSGSINVWLVENVLPSLLANHTYLTDDYTLEIDGESIVLTSKEFSGDYDLSVTPSSANVALIVTQGNEEEINDNLRVVARVYYRPVGSADWNMAPYSLPTHEGKAVLFLDKIVSTEDALSSRPNGTVTTPAILEGTVVACKLEYYDQLGDVTDDNFTAEETTVFYLLPGGVSEQDYKTLDVEGRFNLPFAWLSNVRDNTTVRSDEKIWFYYYHSLPADDLRIRATLHFDDGTSRDDLLISQVQDVDQHRVVAVPCHVDSLAGNTPAGLSIVKYEMWVDGSSNEEISGTLTFTVEDKPCPDESLYIFKNAFGYYEAQYLRGEREENFEGSKKSSGIALPYNTTSKDRGIKDYGATYRKGSKVGSAYLTKEEADNMLDFLMSEDVYKVEVKNTVERLIPVNLRLRNGSLGGTFTYKTSTMLLEIFEAHENQNYSNGRYSV